MVDIYVDALSTNIDRTVIDAEGDCPWTVSRVI